MINADPTSDPAQPDPATGPLAGLRVVEMSSFVATPLCGTVLAQLGAEVVRVEPLDGAPDRTRWPLTDDGVSLYWNGLNPGKRAIAVDLTQEEGRRLVSDLVVSGGPSGGIVVSNNERWAELGYEALRARRPDVVHAVLTGRHDGGTAVDYTVHAASGFPLVSGPEDHDGPVNSVVPAWDLSAGYQLAIALLAAERRRARTGEGSEIRIALEDVAFAGAGLLGYLAEAQVRPSEPREPTGNYVYGTFGRDFTTADGDRFMVVALTPRQWKDLLRVTGLEEAVSALARALGTDFFDEGERFRHRTVLAGLISAWFEQHSTAHVTEALAETRVLWSQYRTFTDLAADDARALRELPLFSTVDQPGVGSLVAPGSPLVVDGRRATPSPAPRIGQDTGSVLADALGIDAEKLNDLAERGVIGTAGPGTVNR
ncbi:2-methylfumaryl-CoA isomerase [Saccharopolyspora rhizosphaerae]|uniref:2-methylfumaryl-CoA isomerase n=1 Tax=Saccharopolyspora rhizosphaerae TaxID=2492662 RepID=A0A3R8QPI3_9PSEU|nr:CoA transferase [Saccharopolyspora rhizosphaerae]RRO16927.1 2-methylfumaryl-CoA isomerase [Saccharopolyspora rhizosphaerae]